VNQLWDCGGQHGEEGEGKEEDRQEEKEVAFEDTPSFCLRHIKAHARLRSRKSILPRLNVVQ
jgi:hypothetical protein